MDATERFPFAFDPRYAWILLPLGVTPHRAEVTVGDGGIAVRFGPWKMRTEIANIAGLEITEHYRWFRAIGIRGSLVDGGITFGSNTRRGLCVKFVEPIPSLFAGGRYRHPGMTLTVADVDGLAATLRRLGAPG